MEVKTFDSTRNREGSPWKLAAQRFASNRLSLASFIFLGFVTLIAIFAYAISPDSTPNANSQQVELATKRPGYSSLFLSIPKTNNTKDRNFSSFLFGDPSKTKQIPISSYKFDKTRLVYTEPVNAPDTLLIYQSIEIGSILFHTENYWVQNDSLFCPANAMRISIADAKTSIEKNNIVKKRFWLGTDRFGRDLLSRLIIGSRVSLSVGFIAVAISLFIGILLGATAGYFRGFYDDIIMWLINVVWSIPTLLMVIALTMVIGKGFWQIFIAVGLTMWVEVARVVRGQVLSLREKEFIEAAKVMGFGSWRIITRHILPNVLGPVIIISASNFATAILLEAGLSFLGIGVQPPIPSWGTMIKDHYGYIIMDKAHLAMLPGLAIMLLVLAFTIIGNGLRDAFDPKTEKV